MTFATSDSEAARLASLARYAVLDTLPEQAFDRLADLAASLFASRVALVNFVADEHTFSKACYGVDLSRSDRKLTFCSWVVELGELVVVSDLALDPRFADHPLVTQEGGFRFYAGAPLKTPDGHSIGTVCVLDDTPRAEVTDEQRTGLTHLAAIAVSELELRVRTMDLERETRANASLVAAIRDSQAVSDALLGVSTLMQLDLPPADLAMRALELVAHVADVDWCSLTAIRGDEAWMEAVWQRDEAARAFTRAIPPRLKPGQGGVWSVANSGTARFVNAYVTEEHATAATVAAGAKASAWLPLGTYDGTAYVVIFTRLHRSTPWSPRDKRLMAAAAATIRHGLEARERARGAEQAARIDLLTGLGNRRAFEDVLAHVAGEGPLGLAALDLDGLTKVNDTLGHAAGDALLRVFAAALAAELPRGARGFRLGGDEFVLLLPGADAEAVGAEALEHLDRAVSAARVAGFEAAGASIGVASWPDEAATPDEALDLANARLYEDKRARKARRAAASSPTIPAFPASRVEIDENGRAARIDGLSVKLSPKEAALLRVLARAPQHVFTREELGAALGLDGAESGNNLDVHVSNLRRKLAAASDAVTIKAVRGRGYTLAM